MRVRELIEKLQEMEQNALVNAYGGYDCEYGDVWNVCSNVEQEACGWDDINECQIFEVFIE